MNLHIENFTIDSNTLSVDFFIDDGVMQHKDFLLDEFQYFAEQNDLLNWSQQVWKENEVVDERYGRISFELYCTDYLCDKDIKIFLRQKLQA